MNNHIMQHLYDLRWRLEYWDGTAPKYGQWTRSESEMAKMASFQRITNLSKAFIERRNRRTFEIDYPVICNGDDYVMFKWDSIGRMCMSYSKNSNLKEQKLPSQIIGLILVSRDHEAICRIDGSPTIICKRSDKDKIYHYAGFGR